VKQAVFYFSAIRCDILTPMNYRRNIAFHCAALFAILYLCPALDAQSAEVKTLAGITSASVLIENLPAGASKLGLTSDLLQTDVELKLRLAGMKVLTSSFIALYVLVNATSDGGAVNIRLELLQPVTLSRDPTIVLGACATWSKERVAKFYNAQDVREAVKDQVDSFLNDWLTVNPKK
jgi:hypothetical protein